jgi:hypoxanthine phosphoribosyltransferase
VVRRRVLARYLIPRRGTVGDARDIASKMPKKKPARPAKDVFNVDWPLFGELSRALALKVAREYDPDLVVGIATAGVVPGAAVAAMLDRPFHSMLVSRRYQAETVRDTPAVFGAAPSEVRGKDVLIVDETCGSGDTLRLAIASVLAAGAADVRSAVSFKTGEFQPDFFGLETESTIVLPWDKEIIVDGELLPNPKYE